MERPLPGGTAFLITVKPLVQVSMTYHPTFAILEFCQSTRLLTKYWYGFLQRKLLQFGTSKVGFHKGLIICSWLELHRNLCTRCIVRRIVYLVIYVVRHLLLGMIHHMLLLIVTNKLGHSAPRNDDRMITKFFPFHDRMTVVT